MALTTRAASGFDDTLDDQTACMAKLIRKIAQDNAFLADPKAIELHKLGLVEFDRDPRPERVEVVGLPTGGHGNRHDRVHR